MSFSSDVKEELSKQINKSRHCQLAEISAILGFLGKIERIGDKQALVIQTENISLAKKYIVLLKKSFGLDGVLEENSNTGLNKGKLCKVYVEGKEPVLKILTAIKWVNQQEEYVRKEELANGLLVKNACCKRAFIRGAFLTSGSMSDPEKSYHFEIVCGDFEKAEQMKEIINSFDMDAKIVQRKKNYVVYLKEGAQIVDMLNVMEAHVALMNLENVRILKEMRNSINRQVNCEAANINKTVNAAVKQIEDIKYIEKTVGLKILNDSLREMAELRLQFPEAALKELGSMLNPSVGKSGVNHRLRKISSIADELKQKNHAI